MDECSRAGRPCPRLKVEGAIEWSLVTVRNVFASQWPRYAWLALGSTATAHAGDVGFRWAILADSGDGMRPLDFSGSPPIVFSGTGLQIYLEHLDNCHIYLYLLDSQDELTPLYPAEKGYYNYGFPRGPKFIPPGDQSFAFVPPPGNETFFLDSCRGAVISD